MKLTLIQLFLISLPLLSLVASQRCQRTCGNQPIKYPFGTGPGCGDPRFQKYVTCNQNHLTLLTHSNCYQIKSIDYSTQIIYITDPTMSTCACMQASKGFSLDWDAPFSFQDNTIVALLDCDISSSSVFKSSGGDNNMTVYCDPNGASVCSLLTSCQAVSRVNTDISRCCVYDPVVLGPSFEMDLQKLKCNSYSGIYGFDGKNMNPNTWNYGVALKYKFNFNNDYPVVCADCEKSNGVCGYYGQYNSFACNCPSGVNTSTDCFFAAPWNNGLIMLPWHTGAWFIYGLAFYLLLI